MSGAWGNVVGVEVWVELEGRSCDSDSETAEVGEAEVDVVGV